MTEEYIRQQVYIGLLSDDDETIIYKYCKDAPEQSSVAPRFEIDREEDRAVLYILWNKNA